MIDLSSIRTLYEFSPLLLLLRQLGNFRNILLLRDISFSAEQVPIHTVVCSRDLGSGWYHKVK